MILRRVRGSPFDRASPPVWTVQVLWPALSELANVKMQARLVTYRTLFQQVWGRPAQAVKTV